MVEQLIKKLLSGQSLNLSQLPNATARTWLVWQLATSPLIQHSGVLLCVADEKELITYQQNLLFWQNIYPEKIPIYSYPEQANIILFNLITQQPQIIVTTVKWEKKLPSLDWWQKNTIKLSTQQNYNLIKFTKDIFALGYERQNKVYASGEFAQRGEIIDLWPINSKNPYRLVWQKNTIEKIYSYDVWSQTKIAEQKEIVVPPIKLTPGNNDLSVFLNKKMLLCHSANTPINLPLPWQIIWHDLTNSTTWPMNFLTPPKWQVEPQQLLQWLQHKTDWKILITSNQSSFIQEKFPQVTIINFPLAQGLVNQSLKLAVITSLELPNQVNVTAGEKFSTLKKTFKPGDYVVHIDHGIGKMTNTVRQNFAGIEKDFFVINYAANDKLYVPIEKADRLEKYIGLARPILHRLSGSNWQHLKQKIKFDLLQTAKKIIYNQAHREVVKIKPLNQHFPEETTLANDFPYTPTADQTQALAEVWSDFKKDKPMDRLICGDVGFGKTEIALRAAFKTILHGQQVALLCPTTILAQQHFDTLHQRLNKFGVNISLLTRFQDQTTQKQIIEKLSTGACDLVIGTHRLLSDDIIYKNLGLLIIDEEQKFGVAHKEKLKKQKSLTHILTLSATPIPRTLYFSVAGLKPISLIQTPPADRLPVISSIEPYQENKIKTVIKQELDRGGQVYYLFNKVEAMPLKVKQLAKLLPKARLSYAHGQMPGRTLSKVMHEFDNKQIDVLVCSTIIENGLDLPNVNTLIVEQAANFGLAQLYQLRGRVGRGQRQAYAYFFYSSQKLTKLAAKRLQALEAAYQLGSGLELSRRDMEIRGIGNLLGNKQHGHIKAVGLNLYLRLLEQAVTELQTGQTDPVENDVHIQLPLTYHLDEKLIPDLEARFDFYQQLAQCQSIEQLKTLVDKTWGKKSLPVATTNLLNILELKIIAQQKNILAIETETGFKNEPKVKIYFQQSLSPQTSKTIQSINPEWLIMDKNIKIKLSALGKNWLEEIKKTIIKL